MSAAEVIAEIEALPEVERVKVLDHLLAIREEDIPASFRRAFADAEAGRGVDMDTALNEAPPRRKNEK
jgi:hypothetical protein